ncbi:MAG TPA: ATP-binding protein [Balneolales bacterium]|nr:ATP-binding protein [Balneolales bacterium]
MTDSVNPDTLKEHLQAAGRQLVREVHTVFEQAYTERIKGIKRIIRDTFDKPLSSEETELEILIRFYAELRTWLDESSTVVSAVLPDDTMDSWNSHFGDIYDKQPEWITLDIPEEFWGKEDDENLFVGIGKSWRRTGRNIYHIRNGAGNSLRRLFKRKKNPWENAKRRLPVRRVTEQSWVIPFKSTLLEEFFQFFRYRSQFITEVHTLTEQMMEPVEHPASGKTGPAVDDLRKSLDRKKEILEKYLFDFDGRMDAFLGQLDEEFDKVWDEAGTLKRPARRFRKGRNEALSRKLKRDFTDGRSAWELHVSATRENWLKDLELSTAQLRLLDYKQKVVEITDDRINKKLIPVFNSALIRIRKSIDALSDEKNKPEELKGTLLTEGRDLIKSLRQDLLPQMADTLVNAHLEQTVQSYQGRSKNIQEDLSEVHSIVREKEDTGLIPKVKIDEVPIKELVREEVLVRLQSGFSDAMTSLRPRLELVSRSISEIDQIVEYNIEAALQILRDREEEPREQAWPVLMEGLERSESKLVTLNQELSDINESIRFNLDDITDTAVNRIGELKDNEEILKLKIRWARARAKDQMRQFRRNIWLEIKRLLPRVKALGRFSASYLRTGVGRVKEITGLGGISEQSTEAISRHLIEFQDQVNRLPFVYRRLFRIEPISDDRLFSGRKDEIMALQRDFDLWKKGVRGTVVIIGERGSGKTTLINDVVRDIYSGYPVITIRFDQTSIDPSVLFETIRDRLNAGKSKNWDELYEALDPNAPVICVIENLHNLFLRKIGGFNAIDEMMKFISRSRDRVYWVISSGLYGWQYLDKALHISRNFSQVITLHNLTPGEMQDLIMRRHRLSGYNLKVKPPENIEHNRKFKKLNTEQEKQDFLVDRLFRNLSEKSDGNIAVAMLFWLSSVRNIGSDFIEVDTDIELDNSFVHYLTTDELFALVVLIQHEVLNSDEMASVMRMETDNADLLLRQMSNRGYVRQLDVNYSVHPFFYRPVVRALSSRNMLH